MTSYPQETDLTREETLIKKSNETEPTTTTAALDQNISILDAAATDTTDLDTG